MTAPTPIVFIVDDEKTIADTLGVILHNSGYEASAFYDAQSALQQRDAAAALADHHVDGRFVQFVAGGQGLVALGGAGLSGL